MTVLPMHTSKGAVFGIGDVEVLAISTSCPASCHNPETDSISLGKQQSSQSSDEGCPSSV